MYPEISSNILINKAKPDTEKKKVQTRMFRIHPPTLKKYSKIKVIIIIILTTRCQIKLKRLYVK